MGRTSDARWRLMDAAHELIWQFGYGAVTVDAICERATVKKGSFYYFFSSKSDLALAAVDAWWSEQQVLIAQVFNSDIPPRDRIKGYIDFVTLRQLAVYEATGRIMGCPIVTLGAEICHYDQALRLRILEILGVMSGLFQDAISEGQLLGQIEPGNCVFKARLVWNYYEGTLTQARIQNNPELLRNLSSEALSLLGEVPEWTSDFERGKILYHFSR